MNGYNGGAPGPAPENEEVIDPEQMEVAYHQGRAARRLRHVKQSPYNGALRISWLDGYESEEDEKA